MYHLITSRKPLLVMSSSDVAELAEYASENYNITTANLLKLLENDWVLVTHTDSPQSSFGLRIFPNDGYHALMNRIEVGRKKYDK